MIIKKIFRRLCIVTALSMIGFFTGCEENSTLIHKVNFNSNGGSAVSTVSVANGQRVMRPANPTRDNYTFRGWYSDAGLNTLYDFTAPVKAAITLYARWTINEYTVAFAVNRGSAVSSVSVAGGQPATPPSDPTREGDTFGGWYSDEALRQPYSFDTPVTADLTLYARWIDDTATLFTVSFNSTGGNAVEAQKIETGGLAAKPTNSVKQGHTFVNWYGDEDLATVFDFNGAITRDTTLYAQWEANRYTVAFKSNEGTAVPEQTIAYGKKTAKPADPTRKSYTFGGWYTDEALRQPYSFDAPVTADFTFYARWIDETATLFTVNFNSVGGNAVEAQKIETGQSAAKPTNPLQQGYAFVNWYGEEKLTTVFDFDGGVTRDTILYAGWEANRYKVGFNSNEGTAVPEQTISYGEKAAQPDNPTREGHIFQGWYGNEDLTTAFDFNGVVTRDTTLYAGWEANRYTVGFNSNEGTAVPEQTISYGEKAAQPDNPTREGHTFQEWYANENLTTAFDFDGAITRDTTLYADWEVNRYKVAFNSNEGTAVPEQTIAYGKKAATPDEPAREGHTFQEWYGDKDLTTAFNFDGAVIQDTTLYADWTINRYTISFVTNGGTPIPSFSMEYGQQIVRPSNPVREGYTFSGWYSDAELNTLYNFTDLLTVDITLHADWTEDAPIVTNPVEGDYAVFDVMVSQIPSEDIILKGTFSTSHTANYANDEDYLAELEYSSDKGSTWNREADKTNIKILASAQSTRVRVPTVSDELKEVLKEELRIRFSLVSGPAGYSTGVIDPITLTIQDDDVGAVQRGSLDKKKGTLMAFDAVRGTLTLTAVVDSVATRKEKEIIDSLYIYAVNAVASVNEFAPAPMNRLYLNYRFHSSAGENVILGSVQPEYIFDQSLSQYKINKWSMRLNAAYAFKEFTVQGNDQPFNQNGMFGRTVVHEYGHILTLHDDQNLYQFDTLQTCDGDSVYVAHNAGAGGYCFFSNSYVVKFITKYYDNNDGVLTPKSGLTPPVVVTDYAATNYKEDLAESYAAYVSVENNAIDGKAATYLDKMAFFDGFETPKQFKQSILGTGLRVSEFGELLNSNVMALIVNFSPLKISHQDCVHPIIID